MTPHIDFGLGYVRIESDYQLIGSLKPHIISEVIKEWTVGLEARVKNLLTNEITVSKKGNVLAITQCK